MSFQPCEIALELYGDFVRIAVNPPAAKGSGGVGLEITLAEFWRRAGLPVARAVEAAAEEARVAAAGGRGAEAISCRKGCGACCRQLATISPAEAWALMDGVDGGKAGEVRGGGDEGGEAESRAGRAAVFKAEAARVERAGLLEALLALDDPALDDEAHYDLARRYFALGLPCPLLRDESCSIHARRPAVCGGYLVSSPAELCARVFEEAPPDEPGLRQAPEAASVGGAAAGRAGNLPRVRRVPVACEVGEAMVGLCAQLLGTGARRVPISLVPVWAGRHAAERGRTWPWDKLVALFELHLSLATLPAQTPAQSLVAIPRRTG